MVVVTPRCPTTNGEDTMTLLPPECHLSRIYVTGLARGEEFSQGNPAMQGKSGGTLYVTQPQTGERYVAYDLTGFTKIDPSSVFGRSSSIIYSSCFETLWDCCCCFFSRLTSWGLPLILCMCEPSHFSLRPSCTTQHHVLLYCTSLYYS